MALEGIPDRCMYTNYTIGTYTGPVRVHDLSRRKVYRIGAGIPSYLTRISFREAQLLLSFLRPIIEGYELRREPSLVAAARKLIRL